MTVDKHTIALISIVGSSLDALGALYLAYVLLGGQHGPLRTLTRAVTYGVLFGVGYGLVFGPMFGVLTGIAHGITLASEYSRASRQESMPGIGYDILVSAIRGLSFGLGGANLYGINFGLSFGILATVGQVIAYRAFGIRATLDYQPTARPRLTKRQFLATLNRSVGYAAAAYISCLFAHEETQRFRLALKIGLAIGVVFGIAIGLTSLIEWLTDHLPERRLGVFGLVLLLIGFVFQSAQYWVALLDVTVR